MIKKLSVALLMGLLAITMLTTGCSLSSTIMTYNFKSDSSAEDVEKERSIYINQSAEKLVMKCKLSFKGTSASVQVLNNATGELAWQGSAMDAKTNFEITLNNVSAGSEYTVKVSGKEITSLKFQLTCDKKLVKAVEPTSK